MSDGGDSRDGGTMLWSACAFVASVLLMYAGWLLRFPW
jgi:hypothetical protein